MTGTDRLDRRALASLERSSLRVSAFVCLAMAAVGIAFAVWSDSDAILLDGVFNGISFFVVLLSSRLAGVIETAGSPDFPFGYAHFEPLLNSVRGLLILTVSGFALVAAIQSLLSGGSGLDPVKGVGYAVVIGVGCAVMAVLQRRRARRTGSPMLVVDAKNWIVNGAITGVVGVAFLIAFLVQSTRFAWMVPYVDGILVIGLVLATVPVPLGILRNGTRQVFQMAPEEPVRRAVYDRVEKVLRGIATDESKLRIIRIGRFLYVAIHVMVAPDAATGGVPELDAIRDRLRESLSDLDERVIVEAIFTRDERYLNFDLLAPETGESV
jgi:predicted Co/Zn/Cd cation transporter (cation efflux family)